MSGLLESPQWKSSRKALDRKEAYLTSGYYLLTPVRFFLRSYESWETLMILDRVKAGYRMPRPITMPLEVYENIVLPCWTFDYEWASEQAMKTHTTSSKEYFKERPSFTDLENVLRRLCSKHPVAERRRGRDWLDSFEPLIGSAKSFKSGLPDTEARPSSVCEYVLPTAAEDRVYDRPSMEDGSHETYHADIQDVPMVGLYARRSLLEEYPGSRHQELHQSHSSVSKVVERSPEKSPSDVTLIRCAADFKYSTKPVTAGRRISPYLYESAADSGADVSEDHTAARASQHGPPVSSVV